MNEQVMVESAGGGLLQRQRGIRSALILCAGPQRQCALERTSQLRWAPEARATVLTTSDASQRPEEFRIPSNLSTQLRALGGTLEIRPLQPGVDLAAQFEAARSLEPDVVIVPRQKRSLRQRLFGEIPEKLARERFFPVLLTQQEGAPPYERVVVGVDFSDSSRAALSLALEMLPVPPEAFTLVHVYEPPLTVPPLWSERAADEVLREEDGLLTRAEERMREFVRPFLPQLKNPRIVLRAGDAYAELRDFIAESEADLVVLGRGAPSTLDRGLGGIAEAVMKGVECDVLVVDSPRGGAPH